MAIDEEQVRYLFESGLNCKQIAERLGTDANYIRRMIPRFYGKETIEESRALVCARLKAENTMLKKKLHDHK